MKRLTVLLIAAIVMTAAGGASSAQRAPAPASSWASDWRAYIAEASRLIASETAIDSPALAAFDGKEVEWTGTVRTIVRPGGSNPHVNLVMPELPISMGSWGSGKINQVGLAPIAQQWGSWDGVVAGDAVVFRTKLSSFCSPTCGNPSMDRAGKVGVMILILNDQPTALMSVNGGAFVRKANP